VQDKDGGVAEYTGTVLVNNVAPSVTAGADTTINQNDTLARNGSFTDPATSDTWTATVNYGDGGGATSLTLAGDHSFGLSHMYTALGTFTVTVQVLDDDGGAGTATFNVTVKDVTPPAVVCGTADGQWHGADVSIACTATDAGSGLANPADASFALSTNVTAGSETANASTGSRQVCDVAGNCVTAGAIAGNQVD